MTEDEFLTMEINSAEEQLRAAQIKVDGLRALQDRLYGSKPLGALCSATYTSYFGRPLICERPFGHLQMHMREGVSWE